MSRPNARLDAQVILPHLDKERTEQQIAKLTGYPLARVQRALTWAYDRKLAVYHLRFKGGNLVEAWVKIPGATFPVPAKPKTRKKARSAGDEPLSRDEESLA